MSDPVLIVEGRRAASWLAGQSWTIGLETPARYPQSKTDQILKLNSDICIVSGSKITKKIEDEWERAAPDGVLLHKLDKDQTRVMDDFLTRHP